jgi:hypothetical protein
MVKIKLPEGYSAGNVDISSIRLEGTVPAEPWPYSVHHEDGKDVLQVKFRRSDVITVLPNGDSVPVHATGKVGTMIFEGVDVIRVIP